MTGRSITVTEMNGAQALITTFDFIRIAEGMVVPARRVTTAEELADALRWSFAESGPHLIEAVVPSMAG